MDAPPVPSLPTDVQESSASTTDLSATVDEFLTDNIGVSESHDMIPSDDEEYCHHLSLPGHSPSIDVVRFRFGGSPMHSQCSDNGCSEDFSEAPLTLSDIRDFDRVRSPWRYSSH